jgi:hypothetical protein
MMDIMSLIACIITINVGEYHSQSMVTVTDDNVQRVIDDQYRKAQDGGLSYSIARVGNLVTIRIED